MVDYDFSELASSPSVTVPLATTMAITQSGHGRSVGDPIRFTVATGSAPLNLANATTYFVKRVLSSSTYTLSATAGGQEIAFPTVVFSMLTTGVINVNWPLHGRAVDTAIRFVSTGNLPAAITSGTTYYVKSQSTNDITSLSASTPSSGGAALLYPTATVTIANPCVVTRTSHGLASGATVQFGTGGSLPTGLAAKTTYYVANVVDANTFTISASLGGGEIITTGTQSGTHYIDTGAVTGTSYVDLSVASTFTVNSYFSGTARSLYVGTAGNMTLVMPNNDVVAFTAVPVGMFPVRARAVLVHSAPTTIAAMY
jgi:hypothetical protein